MTKTASMTLVVLLMSVADLCATDYYVSTTGNDITGTGTLARPFQTIQKAANVATAGSIVNVLGGTYHETVNMRNSGTSESNAITFQPYKNQQVTLTGLASLSSGWTPYTSTAHPSDTSIYRATAANGASQLFLGDRPMIEARSSITSSSHTYNNPFNQPCSTLTNLPPDPPGTWPLQFDIPPNYNTWKLTSSAITEPTGSWGGGDSRITWRNCVGSVVAANIRNQVGATIENSLLTDRNEGFFFPYLGGPFYLSGSPVGIDTPKEWAYNSASHTVYFHAPNGASPNNQDVKVRTLQNAVDFNGQSFINVRGFKVQAASMKVNGNHNLIDNCQILYPSTAGDIPVGMADGNHSTADGVVVSGQYNTIDHSEIAYSYGDGVTLKNSHNTVQGCLIHDCDQGGVYSAPINAMNAPGGNNTFQHNTIYNSGKSGIELAHYAEPPNDPAAPNNLVQYNDIGRFGILTEDKAAIDTFHADATGTVIAYNKIHDARGSGENTGIRLDCGAKGVTVHHNLVTNCGKGIVVNRPSTNHNIYNNTLVVDGAAMTDSVAEGYVHTNVKTMNNLTTSGGFVGNEFATNLCQTTAQFNNPAAGDYTLRPNGPGMSARDSGTVIDGITDGYTGTAPDIGAFESGRPAWTAGADFKTWTAGNQRAATLASAMYVKSDGLRWNDASVGMRVGRYSSNDSTNRRAFMKFALPDLSDVHGQIAKAVLRVYENATPDNATGTDVTLYRVTSNWTDTGVSYDQSVDMGSGISRWYDWANLDLYTDIDITSWVQDWINHSSLEDPLSNHGLSLRSTIGGIEGSAGSAKYFDGYYGVTAPQLIITAPEPSVLILITTGLLGALAYAWKRRRGSMV
jgi:hypothetical protein